MILVNMLGQFSGILCALLAYGLAYIDGRGGLVRPCLFRIAPLIFLTILFYSRAGSGHSSLVWPFVSLSLLILTT